MSYIDKNLIAGESVLYRTGLHWIVLVGPLSLAALFGVPALVIAVMFLTGQIHYSGPAGFGCLLLFAIGVIAAISGFLRRSATEMAVTNRRVIIKTGILSRKTCEVLLSKVESFHVEEGLLGRILGYGSVLVRGTGGTPEPFHRIAHPLELRRQVDNQTEACQGGTRVA
jgi:uncharacterized membrane protein YdbT with pleckstrin-like domain